MNYKEGCQVFQLSGKLQFTLQFKKVTNLGKFPIVRIKEKQLRHLKGFFRKIYTQAWEVEYGWQLGEKKAKRIY